jgi:hypothetical protein
MHSGGIDYTAKIQFGHMSGLIRIFLCATLVLASLPVISQVRLGIKGGLSSSEIPASSLLILDQSDLERFRIEVVDAKYGLHLGLFIQAEIGYFFLQPEVLFNTVSYDYSVEDLQNATPRLIKDELYRNLDVPLILGFKFGPVRIGGGPVGHLFLDSTSDLNDIEGYEGQFDRFTYGWQAGIGLDIWKLHLDARYEGNFNNYGDHIIFFGREYRFTENPSRVIVSAGISF